MAIVTAQEASSSTNRYNYQVFLSFRGDDTRKTFTDHLYTALIESGIRTFRDDDEIERGRKLEFELRKAIKESRVSIIVFSKNYAFSKWCLNEVEMIMEWSRTGRHEVLPVFYDVDPSDVRSQTGSIGEAFASYEEKFIDAETDVGLKKEWMEKLKCWRVALKEVANLTGMVLQNQVNGDDDEIERGRKLEFELRKAIKESRVSIIVFSKNYAFSKWCLNEVEMIMEWSRTGRHEVLPVFYDVDPSDVRSQTGSIGEAFASYEEKFIDAETDVGLKKEWMEKLKCWRVALKEVANLTGMVLQNQVNGHEAMFIRKILKEVDLKLNRAVLHVDSYLIGMLSRVANINSWVQISSSVANILVICGMGGIGKTTIAKFVYNSNYHSFEGHCFIGNVKEKAKQPNGLVNIQMQLLSSILKRENKEIYDVDAGVLRIHEAINCKRILIVIDDVDEVEHLDALCGTREFYPGSKIIITTRNRSLLKAHVVHKLHIVDELSFSESLELFCWHAFGKKLPGEGYQEQSARAVNHCRGVPLALKILGSSLAGKSKQVWVSAIEKFKAIHDPKIMNVLKISFDSLQDGHDRNLFLHIAFFFVGEDKDEVIEILDACDFFTAYGIENLVDRCLISITSGNRIEMHQLLQEMGYQIVEQESLNEPWKRRRLWRPKDPSKMLQDIKGTETVEGLILDAQMYKHDTFDMRRGTKRSHDDFVGSFFPSNKSSSFRRQYSNFLSSAPSSKVVFNYAAFSNMINLKLLKLSHVEMSGNCQSFPESLRWLCWHQFPFKSIPFHLHLWNLVSLDMKYSKLEDLSFGNKVYPSLKIINLSYSERFVKTPDFGRLPNLEKLILEGCVSLGEVCDTIGNLKRLALLNLKDCNSLKKFPNIGMLNSLKEFVVDGCPKLFENSAEVVDTNEATSTLRSYAISLLNRWVSKPIFRNPENIRVSLPCSLVRLTLRNCNISGDELPFDLSNLRLLENLDLSYNRFRNFPRIGSLNRLKSLNLSNCRELRSISGLPNIDEIGVSECESLESVTYEAALVKPSDLRYYSFIHTGCSKLKEIEDVFKLEPLGNINRGILDSLGLCSSKLTRNLKMKFTDYVFTYTPINLRQGLYEFGIFSTFLYEEEIPSWCVDGSNKGSSFVSIVVPSHPSLRIQGLNMYIMYEYCEGPDNFLLFSTIENKSKGLCWMYTPILFAVPNNENKKEKFVWVSHWRFGNHHQLVSGDQLHISVNHIYDNDPGDVKEFGIEFVWGEEEEEEEMNTRREIGGDLSSFEFSTGVFILTNTSIHYLLKPDNFFGRLVGDNFRDKVIDPRRWGLQPLD